MSSKPSSVAGSRAPSRVVSTTAPPPPPALSRTASKSSVHSSASQPRIQRSPSKAAPSYEQAILEAHEPLPVDETTEITVHNVKGIHVNKKQTDAWKGELPLDKYALHEDANPEVVHKKTPKRVYQQLNAVRLLKPCDAKPAGDIVIEQQPDRRPEAAPPVHIVVPNPNTPKTPEPIVVREAPPKPPCPIEPKHIVLPGKTLEPPKRRVIVEHLPEVKQAPPQNTVVERWLPYADRERKVIFKQAEPVAPEPLVRNLTIVWESPEVEVTTETKIEEEAVCLCPKEYKCKYGAELKKSDELPEFAKAMKAPNGGVWAAEKKCYAVPKLVGDLHALCLIDLDKEGLSEYKSQLQACLAEAAAAAASPTPLAKSPSCIGGQCGGSKPPTPRSSVVSSSLPKSPSQCVNVPLPGAFGVPSSKPPTPRSSVVATPQQALSTPPKGSRAGSKQTSRTNSVVN